MTARSTTTVLLVVGAIGALALAGVVGASGSTTSTPSSTTATTETPTTANATTTSSSSTSPPTSTSGQTTEAPSTTAGAENDESGSQRGATETTGAGAEGQQQSESVVAQVDSDLVVLDYGVDDGAMSITFRNRGDATKRVTVAEVVEGDTGRFAIARYSIPAGSTTTVELPLRRPRDSAGVTVTTAESVEQGYGTFLSTGGSISPPFRSDALGLIGGSAASFGGIIAWKRRKEKKQTEQVREVGGT